MPRPEIDNVAAQSSAAALANVAAILLGGALDMPVKRRTAGLQSYRMMAADLDALGRDILALAAALNVLSANPALED